MRNRRLPATLALLCACTLAAPPALAEPVDPTPPTGAPSQQEVDRARAAVDAADARQRSLERELQAAQEELDRVNDSAQLATENYNEARVLLAQRTAAAAEAEQDAARAQRAAAAEKGRVDDLAASVYMQGGSLDETFGLLLGLAAGPDMARNAADMDAISGYRAGTLADARAAAAKAQAAERAAAQAQLRQRGAAARSKEAFDAAERAVADAQRRTQALEARRAAAIDELARLRHTSAQVEQARLEALAQQRAERAAQERARAAMAAAAASAEAAEGAEAAAGAEAQRGDSGAAVAPADLPEADSKAAQAAIAYAQQQLGKPYKWGAEGPDSFDCSGLTLRAWEAGGRSLTHYSRAQYQETSRVPVEELAPGDLVFFGSSEKTIHHVGLYVGDGKMIEAPRTGLDVRYSSIYRSSLLPYGGRP